MLRKRWLPVFAAVVLLLSLTVWEKTKTPLASESTELMPAAESATSESDSSETAASEPEAAESTQIKLTLLGDIMCHPTQYEAAQTSGGYDFNPSFEEIGKNTRLADLTLANLETTLAGKEMTYSGYPSFNTPEQMADAVRNTLGVDVVSTANNHSLDRNFSGLSRMIDFLDQYGLKHTGTYQTAEDSQEILIQEISGLRIAFLSYTYGTNGVTLPKGKAFAVNYLDREKILRDAEKARTLGADLVIASLHWGTEYAVKPSAEQINLATWIFENTEVDIIAGNHVHAVQPITFLQVKSKTTGKEKEGLVIYAQGNFISDQKTDTANMGIMVDIFLDIRSAKKPVITHVAYYPTWVDETPGAGPKTYRVLNVTKALADYQSGQDPLLDSADYAEMRAYVSQIKQTIPSENKIRFANK
ncbi:MULTISPECIES: CapA family protein [unclassified Dehalobacter]|uniref:CapA family protein n=1 Tax=unclassified Dehalobacter TaxID=2635733 RepID=UPI000E6CED2A|nr:MULTISPECIES: CapA family protein [unclassified Dehalobacter]RJE47862.1 capsule biosynthesis protein CapA [Dehalobacter sp. MCB1]TCX48985.1 capsule biosynthesis protein CapA [Dehalobacter sp. 14DCB1]TCX56693.1 capsule biosynthesis protein CapA [Dehalobacter sp. 12DCB1]